MVWSSTSFTYTHEKTAIIDGRAAWIMTMNCNKSSPKVNREFLAIDTNLADVAEATRVFAADHAHQPITPSGALVVAPMIFAPCPSRARPICPALGSGSIVFGMGLPSNASRLRERGSDITRGSPPREPVERDKTAPLGVPTIGAS